jgi:hypothetical protein
MFKEFLIRKLIQSKLDNLPKEERDKIISVVTKNPEFFQKIAMEIKAKQDSGMDQMKATMAVMEAHKDELQKLMA